MFHITPKRFFLRMATAGKSRFSFSSELGDFVLDATVIVDRIAAKSTET